MKPIFKFLHLIGFSERIILISDSADGANPWSQRPHHPGLSHTIRQETVQLKPKTLYKSSSRERLNHDVF